MRFGGVLMGNKKYDKEFKIEAVRLAAESDNVSLIEKNLGIGRGCIYNWKKELENEKDPIKKAEKKEKKIIKKLEAEVKRLREERNILKKAIGIFSKNPNQYSDL